MSDPGGRGNAETRSRNRTAADGSTYTQDMTNKRTPRDVLADRIAKWAGAASVYDYADRLIKDLDAAGFSITATHPDDVGVIEHPHAWSHWSYRYCLVCDAVLSFEAPGIDGDAAS